MENKGNLIFDYDGTLHETMAIYGPAFRKNNAEMAARGLLPSREYSDSEISRWLGFSAPDMWRCFAPGLSEAERGRASQRIQEEMQRLIEAVKARLYPGIPALLTRLKEEGFHLFLLSNCTTEYLLSHRSFFCLDRWFDAYDWGEQAHWAPKTERLKALLTEHPGPAIMIGDRFHDFEAASHNGIPSIACRYGYGTPEEYECASAQIGTPKELYPAILRLFDLSGSDTQLDT